MSSVDLSHTLLPLAQVSGSSLLIWILGLIALAGWACAALLHKQKQAPSPAPQTKDPSSLLPIHALVMDLSLVERELEALQHSGLHSIASHLELNPGILASLRKKARILEANRHTLNQLGAKSIDEVQNWWDTQVQKPWTEIFKYQVFLLWSDLDRIEQEIIYETERHEELTCHMRCSMTRIGGKLDTRHALLSVTDITLAKGGKVSDSKETDILRDIFSQANMLVWRAKVRRENGHFLWRVRLPLHASSSPLYKMAGALEVGGLWDMSRMPDSARMDATSQEAMLSGRNHYEQDFRSLCSDGTHWIHEDVIIQKITDDEWNLVAVATEVTARHRAEEAHEESQFQIQQILQSADCLLWRAQVLATPPTTIWKMFVPASVLYRRIFGYDPDNNLPLLWQNQNIPERPELDARSTRALFEGWPGYEQEFRVIARGATFWLHEHVSITKKSDTEWTLVGVIMDVTARREAEIELASEKERLAQALSRLQAAGLNNETAAASKAPSEAAAPMTSAASTTTPIETQQSASAPRAETPASKPSSTRPQLKGRLLLMDDEEPIQRLAMRLIKRLGLDVEVCSDGTEAVEKYTAAMAAGQPFDIVMMDLHIPGGLGGRETIGLLRQINPSVKALVSSGATNEIDADELERLGFAGTIPKPYDIATLTRSFQALLGQ